METRSFQVLFDVITRHEHEWSLNGNPLHNIVLDDDAIRFVKEDGSEYTCRIVGDHAYTIRDIPRTEGSFLGATLRTEEVWLYDTSHSKPGDDVPFILVNASAREENDRVIAEQRTRRDARTEADRTAKEAARKKRRDAYQKEHIAPLVQILVQKSVQGITFGDGRFSINVGGLRLVVTPDMREDEAPSDERDRSSVGLHLNVGDHFHFSTHDADE